MKRNLSKLNVILMMVFPYTWGYLRDMGLFNYISPQLLGVLTLIWMAVTLNFTLARFPAFRKEKTLFVVINSLFTFAVVVSLMVIYFVD